MANRYFLSEASLTLKLKVGNKGYVIIPKAIMEAAGVKEGDELIISLINLVKHDGDALFHTFRGNIKGSQLRNTVGTKSIKY